MQHRTTQDAHGAASTESRQSRPSPSAMSRIADRTHFGPAPLKVCLLCASKTAGRRLAKHQPGCAVRRELR